MCGAAHLARMTQTTSTVLTVRERVAPAQPGGPERYVHHLPAPGVVESCEHECDWHEIVCGGGIAAPGGFDEVPTDQVCPDCLAGRVTMAPAPERPTRRRRRH